MLNRLIGLEKYSRLNFVNTCASWSSHDTHWQIVCQGKVFSAPNRQTHLVPDGPSLSVPPRVINELIAISQTAGWRKHVSRLDITINTVLMGPPIHNCVNQYGWEDYTKFITGRLTPFGPISPFSPPSSLRGHQNCTRVQCEKLKPILS